MKNLEPITDSNLIEGIGIKYFEYLGIWKSINDCRTTGKKNIIFKLHLIIILLLLGPFIFFGFISFFAVKMDVMKGSMILLHHIPAIKISFIIIVLWFKLGDYSKICDVMTINFLTLPEDIKVVTNGIYLKITKKTYLYLVIALLVNFGLIGLNIVDPSVPVKYITDYTGDLTAVTGGRYKISITWYPIPFTKTPYYEMIYLYESMVINSISLYSTVFLYSFYQLLVCLTAHYTVLGHYASSLKINNKNDKSNSQAYKHLCSIIKDHNKILSYTDELKNIYNPVVTVFIGIGFFVLVIAVFNFIFGKTGSPMFIIKSIQFMFYQSLEVCMMCISSTAIETSSSELHFAIYNSDWFKADKKFRIAAQMLMVRARKGIMLTALRMYPVNMETMMDMFQLTYTVAAMLSRMSE